MTVMRITENEILEELAKRFKGDTPDDALTVREMMGVVGCTHMVTIHRLLRKLHDAGRVRSHRKQVQSIDGVMRWSTAYTILPER